MVIKKSQQEVDTELDYLTPASFQCVWQWAIDECDLQGEEGTEDPPVECEYGSAMVLPVVISKENEFLCDSSVHTEND